MPLLMLQPGMLATIVTYLEMTAPPSQDRPAMSPLRLDCMEQPDVERYRALFRKVGEPWLWFSRLVMDSSELQATLSDPLIEVHVVTNRSGADLGLLELDFREGGTCELAYFGLVPEMTGRSHGKWLMQRAMALAWREGVERLQVRTASFDHPAALDFYQRHGFRPYARAVETFVDPRVACVLPETAAPQVPLIGLPA